MDEISYTEILQEGREDLIDARQLAVSGIEARSMAIYHARQATEKLLQSLAQARGIQPNYTWSIQQLWSAIGEEQPDISDCVTVLTEQHEDTDEEGLKQVIDAALKVMEFVYGALGVEAEPLPEVRAPVMRPKAQNKSPRKRNVSRGKRFYVCSRCGVKVPFTHQTARGRVPCPQCGRLMRLIG